MAQKLTQRLLLGIIARAAKRLTHQGVDHALVVFIIVFWCVQRDR